MRPSILLLLFALIAAHSYAEDSTVALARNMLKAGDEYFQRGAYRVAWAQYEALKGLRERLSQLHKAATFLDIQRRVVDSDIYRSEVTQFSLRTEESALNSKIQNAIVDTSVPFSKFIDLLDQRDSVWIDQDGERDRQLFLERQRRDLQNLQLDKVQKLELLTAQLLPYLDAADRRIGQIEDIARKGLMEAKNHAFAQRVEQAIRAFVLVQTDFPQSYSAMEADKELLKFTLRPDVKGQLNMAKAASLETQNKFREALALYKEVAEHPRLANTALALKAHQAFERLSKDPKAKLWISTEQMIEEDKKALVALNAAKNFLMNRMQDQARTRLREIVEKYPESRYAVEAKKLLTEIPVPKAAD